MPVRYTDEFKRDAVALFESGIAQKTLCEDLGWRTFAQATVIITLAGPGLVLAFVLTARSRKVA